MFLIELIRRVDRQSIQLLFQNLDLRRKDIMIEMGLPDYWRKHGFPAQCRDLGHDDFECVYEEKTGPTEGRRRSRAGAPN